MLLSEIFLKENLQLPDGVIAQVREHCQPYLQAVGNDLTKFMYRGVSENTVHLSAPTNIPKLYIVPGYRNKRVPVSVTPSFHKSANAMFKKAHGVPFRNGLFVTGHASTALMYGEYTTVIFPIGDFKFCWSPEVKDLYYITNKRHFNDVVFDTYKTTDLPQAIQSDHEIMLYCEKCFMFITDLFED